ncbi:SA1362 family protein [Rossellomorea aquimaris]|uniref:SA1362 family protein n=1 Tax=Rossellomorea aquimaris TaxID=189382 RepID=UPI0009EEBD6B|nr:SA1362 family protein [Rossellomorea aquimaris]
MNARIIVVFTLILLAILGLGSWLIENPLGLLRQVLVSAAVIGIIYFIYRRWFSQRRAGSNEQRAFLKAAKQSKKRHKKQPTSKAKAQGTSVSKKRSIRKKSNANLTVIEGKKNKKNNRASF